jgi:hypothetical protein
VICFVKLYYFSIIFYRIFCLIASKTGVMTQPHLRERTKVRGVFNFSSPPQFSPVNEEEVLEKFPSPLFLYFSHQKLLQIPLLLQKILYLFSQTYSIPSKLLIIFRCKNIRWIIIRFTPIFHKT